MTHRDVAGAIPFRYPLASVVGRERGLDEIWSVFRERKRLVTETGTGFGKTCLAMQLCLSASDLGNVSQAGSL
jgi:ATP/maltotriose-dependent transcriptional regulator MalT